MDPCIASVRDGHKEVGSKSVTAVPGRQHPGIGHVGQWDRLAVEYAGWVRIVGT
jgi:hypothetical protein